MNLSAFPAHQGAVVRLCAISAAVLAASVPALAQTRLPTVTVTATRFPDAAEALPFGVSVVTADDIRNAGAATVNEALMKLLGVVGRLDTSGGNNYGLDLRGFGSTASDNQVVIVDGLRLNEADLSSARLSSIPIDTVEKIEVLRGTGAVLYGQGATGGVIVITTKAGMGVDRNNTARVYAAAGSNGLRETRGSATIASGGFSVDAAASKRESDGHRVNFASESDTTSVAGQWSNGWLRLGVRAGRAAQSSGLPGSLTPAQYAADPHQASSTTDYAAIQTRSSGLFAEATVGDWLLAADSSRRAKDYSAVNVAPWGYTVDAENHSLRARHQGLLGQMRNALVLGYDRNQWESASVPAGTSKRATSQAWYVKDDLTLSGSGTRLSIGLRTEELDKTSSGSTGLDGREDAWELGVSQPLGDGITAYGRIGRSFRLANVDEFTFTVPGTTLQPQVSRDVELGARWQSPASRVEVRLYRSALRNEIGYDPNAAGPFAGFGFPGANVNFDPTRRRGLELEASHALSPTLDLRVNAAVRQARFTAGPYAGNDIALVPKRTLALHADWRPAAGHAVTAGVMVVASQKTDFANTCSIPAYATADLRYAYNWRNVELALGIANLTDKKYYTQAFRCAQPGVTTAIYPEAGRTMTASVMVTF